MVKNLDTKCEDERVSELIYEIVNLLMGDEDQSNPLDTYSVKLPAEEGVVAEGEKVVDSSVETVVADVAV